MRTRGQAMFDRIQRALKAQPAAGQKIAPKRMRATYRHWRIRVMYSLMVGYASLYLVRKNFSMAMPSFLDDFGYSKTDLGLILSLFSILYGAGKLCNGIIADHANPRYFLALALLGSAAVNLLFGLSAGLTAFGIFWIFNAWFQSMGCPPCIRLLTHWYGPRELGTAWGIWNIAHQIGGAGIFLLAGWLIPQCGWRAAFFVPAAIAALAAIFIINRLRDTPASLGLPPIELYRRGRPTPESAAEAAEAQNGLLRREVLGNRWVWCLSFATFFVYIVRIGVLDWAPTYLTEARGASLGRAGLSVAGFEIAGIAGSLVAGLLSDRVFKGRRAPVNVLFMALLIFFLASLWRMPAGSGWLDAGLLIAVGFLVYGPQMLSSVAAVDVSSNKVAAAATGMTGLFGYLGSTACGVGTGLLVDRWGWDGAFIFYIAAAVAGTLLFLMTLRSQPRGATGCHARMFARAAGPSISTLRPIAGPETEGAH
jgi:phosphoglycerate transporter family protein